MKQERSKNKGWRRAALCEEADWPGERGDGQINGGLPLAGRVAVEGYRVVA